MRLKWDTNIVTVCMGKGWKRGGRECHLGKQIDERGKSQRSISIWPALHKYWLRGGAVQPVPLGYQWVQLLSFNPLQASLPQLPVRGPVTTSWDFGDCSPRSQLRSGSTSDYRLIPLYSSYDQRRQEGGQIDEHRNLTLDQVCGSFHHEANLVRVREFQALLSSLTLYSSSHCEQATIMPTPFNIAHSLPSDQCVILFFLPFQFKAYFLKCSPLKPVCLLVSRMSSYIVHITHFG